MVPCTVQLLPVVRPVSCGPNRLSPRNPGLISHPQPGICQLSSRTDSNPQHIDMFYPHRPPHTSPVSAYAKPLLAHRVLKLESRGHIIFGSGLPVLPYPIFQELEFFLRSQGAGSTKAQIRDDIKSNRSYHQQPNSKVQQFRAPQRTRLVLPLQVQKS